jgi:hypothetical protein
VENIQQNWGLEQKCTISAADLVSSRWNALIWREISFSTKRNDDLVPTRISSHLHPALHLLYDTWEYFEPRRRQIEIPVHSQAIWTLWIYHSPVQYNTWTSTESDVCSCSNTDPVAMEMRGSAQFQHTQYSRSNIVEHRLYTFVPPAWV